MRLHGVGKGVVLGLMLHLLQIPLASLTYTTSLWVIGLSQLVYMVPAVLTCRWKRRPDEVKGLLIVAALTFLLNAACFGLFVMASNFGWIRIAG